ncbi:hypothetical protein D3C74_234960 [compost metagenome]
MHMIMVSPNRDAMVVNQLLFSQINRILLQPLQLIISCEVSWFMGNNQIRPGRDCLFHHINGSHKTRDDPRHFLVRIARCQSIARIFDSCLAAGILQNQIDDFLHFHTDHSFLLHPLTAPMTTPLVKYFCRNGSTMTIGRMPMTAMAMRMAVLGSSTVPAPITLPACPDFRN